MNTREELTRQAEKALRQGRVDEAIAQYQELAHLEPVDWGLVKLLADLLERAGQRESAAQQFARWGNHLFAEGFHSKAAALYKKVLKLEPSDDHALWQLAEVSLELKLKADARVAFQRVAELRQRRGDAAGAAAARERLAAIEFAPAGPPAPPVRPPAYASSAPPEAPVAPIQPPAAPAQGFTRHARPELWAGGEPEAASSIAPPPVAPPPVVTPPPAPPPETVEARQARLRREAESADAAQAADADARWQAVLDVDPQDVAVRLRLVQAALDRGDLAAAERLGESLDASETTSLTVLVELAFRRARPDALQRLVAGRVHAGAPPEHVLAPCVPLAARHPGAARAVLGAAVSAWTAAGQPGHAVLALEHGESLGLLTTAMHLQWVEICVDAGLPGLSRAQRGLALAYVAEQRFVEARAVAEDLFLREAGEEPHRALLLDILDRQGHPDPHRVLVDLLTPPSDSLDETDAFFAVEVPAAPLVPADAWQAPVEDYGYLPPLQVPLETEVRGTSPQDSSFLDTGDSSIAMLDVDALLAAQEAPAPTWSEPTDVAVPEGEASPWGDLSTPAHGASLDDGLAWHVDDRTDSQGVPVGDAAEDCSIAPVADAVAPVVETMWPPEGPVIAAIDVARVAPPEPTPPPSPAAAAAFDWAAILGRDVDGVAAAMPEPVAAPRVEPVAPVARPVAPAPVTQPPVEVVEPQAEPVAVAAAPPPDVPVSRPPAAPPTVAAPPAVVEPTSPTPPPATPAGSGPDVDTSPFATLAQLQPVLDEAAPLQPSFEMPSAWLSDSPDAPPRPRGHAPEDDYVFAEELPARWERSRLGIPAPEAAPADNSVGPTAPERMVLEPAPDAPAAESPVAAPPPATVPPAADAAIWPADDALPHIESVGAPEAEPVPLVEEEIDLTQLLEELRQFDTVLPDMVPRAAREGAFVPPPPPAPPAPIATVEPAVPDGPAAEPQAVVDDTHHDDLLPELPHPSPNEGATELDAVFDDLQRQADDRGVAEQQLAAGRVFLAAGLASEAARAFERASLEPRTRFGATLALAELHKSRGQLQEAVSWYEQAAMAPVPDAAVKRPVLYDLAESLEALGESDRALGVLLDLLSQVEDYRDARARLDRLLRVDAGG
jgi:tetratricopeptide (TPR) repeat protein